MPGTREIRSMFILLVLALLTSLTPALAKELASESASATIQCDKVTKASKVTTEKLSVDLDVPDLDERIEDLLATTVSTGKRGSAIGKVSFSSHFRIV